MPNDPKETDERRDAALRRMLATPKAKKDRGAEAPLSPSQKKPEQAQKRQKRQGKVKLHSDHDT